MKKYYVQLEDQILPLLTATSLYHAERLEENHSLIVETDEDVYLDTLTGKVGFESDWDNLDRVVKASYDADTESWIEAR